MLTLTHGIRNKSLKNTNCNTTKNSLVTNKLIQVFLFSFLVSCCQCQKHHVSDYNYKSSFCLEFLSQLSPLSPVALGQVDWDPHVKGMKQ